jgi:subtilisin family serine protease
MKHRISLLSAAIGASLVLATAAGTAYAADFRTAKNPVDGQYIVVLKNSAATLAGESNRAARVPVVAKEIAATHRAQLLRSFDRALRGFVVKADDAALAQLLADPRIAYVEEDGYVRGNPTQANATWGIDRIDQRNLPLSGTYTYNTTAANVHAYVIDSGLLASHTEFTGRVGNGFDAVGGGTNDCNGHGTHVAGTLGGTTWGVAKGVTIHPVRVLGCDNTGTWAGVIQGIDWVANNHLLPAVANMSLGGGVNTAVDTAVANLTNAGVTVVVAAGNGGVDACGTSPARAPSAITVGSTDANDARSIFGGGQSSSWGTCLDIFAPGTSITSAWNTGNSATNTISGTSMASPHVAGAAALHLAANPTATPAQVTAAILNNATPNLVTDARAGSPNLLLFTLGTGNGVNKIFEQTDASGKITIAVFERVSPTASAHNTDFAVTVPDDYVVIGGGGEGKEFPQGNLITASYPNAGLTAWLVSTKDHVASDPVQVRGWAIGLKIAGLTPAQVRSNVSVTTATSNFAAWPDVTATVPAGFVLAGGGVRVNWSGAGNLATASAPSGGTGWRVRSKDHYTSSPATATAYAIGLSSFISGVGTISTIVNGGTSGVIAHPSFAQGLTPGYALSGCGAFVNWSGAGNLLWQLRPTSPGAGQAACAAASKDHVISSPSSISTYSIGLQAN